MSFVRVDLQVVALTSEWSDVASQGAFRVGQPTQRKQADLSHVRTMVALGSVAGVLAPDHRDPGRQRSGFCRGSRLGRSSGKGQDPTRRRGGRPSVARAHVGTQRLRSRSGSTRRSAERRIAAESSAVCSFLKIPINFCPTLAHVSRETRTVGMIADCNRGTRLLRFV